MQPNQRCALCGSTENVEVHHKNGNRSNIDSENLISLCSSCHSHFHARARTKQSYNPRGRPLQRFRITATIDKTVFDQLREIKDEEIKRAALEDRAVFNYSQVIEMLLRKGIRAYRESK